MDIIQQILFNTEGVKISLDNIAQNGIPIKDTFAPITAGVNILGTIFSTFIGGYITLKFYKSQEKLRIREGLKLDFYKEYEELYKPVLVMFCEYVTNIELMSILVIEKYNGEEKEFIKIIENQELGKQDIESNFDMVEYSSEKIDDLRKELEKIETFMESKKVITGYNEYKYKDIKQELDEYSSYFQELILYYTFLFPNKKPEQKVEVKVGETQIIKKYEKIFQKIYDKNKRFNLLLNNMQDIHEEITQEFIAQYFTKK